MKRSQRRFHAYLWPVLAIVMAATLIVAIAVRHPPTPAVTAPSGEMR